jgi:hypothetical protein
MISNTLTMKAKPGRKQVAPAGSPRFHWRTDEATLKKLFAIQAKMQRESKAIVSMQVVITAVVARGLECWED